MSLSFFVNVATLLRGLIVVQDLESYSNSLWHHQEQENRILE